MKYAILNNLGMVERMTKVTEALANPPPNWIAVNESVGNVVGMYYYGTGFSANSSDAVSNNETATPYSASDYYPMQALMKYSERIIRLTI